MRYAGASQRATANHTVELVPPECRSINGVPPGVPHTFTRVVPYSVATSTADSGEGNRSSTASCAASKAVRVSGIATARPLPLASASVTALVDRLERLDLVRRERDTEDRRRGLLTVSDRAHDLG